MTTLTVSELIEERKARELSEKQLDDQLKLRHKEELTEFKKRLDQFQLADWHVDAIFKAMANTPATANPMTRDGYLPGRNGLSLKSSNSIARTPLLPVRWRSRCQLPNTAIPAAPASP